MKNNNKKNLVVTLADKNYLQAAKQLFSSLYFNSGWQGDYMLLAHEIENEELAWFETKGIKIYKTKKLGNRTGPGKYPPVVLSKFFLFKKYFKKWNKIIFLDADIIIRGSLNNLLKQKGFNAPETETHPLSGQFSTSQENNKYIELRQKYNLKEKSLCSGVFIFDTKIISENSFNDLLNLYKKYRDLALYGEESIFNLYFYKNWNMLPFVYNFNPDHANRYYNAKANTSPTTIIHFGWSIPPWNNNSLFYQEWIHNLNKANNINLEKRLPPFQNFSEKKINDYLKKIKRIKKYKLIILYIDKQIGKLGKIIKKISPNFYKIIKNEK